MQTLKAFLILALLCASADSYSKSQKSKGGPQKYKGERECKDVMDCVKKKLCQAAFPFGAVGCKCHQNECESFDSCETDKV